MLPVLDLREEMILVCLFHRVHFTEHVMDKPVELLWRDDSGLGSHESFAVQALQYGQSIYVLVFSLNNLM